MSIYSNDYVDHSNRVKENNFVSDERHTLLFPFQEVEVDGSELFLLQHIGLSNASIAEKMQVPVSTVDRAMSHLQNKLGVSNRDVLRCLSHHRCIVDKPDQQGKQHLLPHQKPSLYKTFLHMVKQDLVKAALQVTHSYDEAAAYLGVSQQTVADYMKKMGVDEQEPLTVVKR